jgi:hypothetical protein
MHLPRLRESQLGFDQPSTIWSRVGRYLVGPALFGIIPLVFLVSALQLTKASGPQWLGSNFENSYMYLFNSMLVANGQPAYQCQHPGTTTELFGATCLRLSTQSFGESLVNSVLNNPESALKHMHRALLGLCAVAIWFFPLLAAERSGSLLIGLLLQAPLLFFSTIYGYSIWYGSDLFQIIPGIAIISICILLIRQQEDGRPDLMTCVFAGMVCGIGVATKLTFFPLILVAIFCCWGLKPLLSFFGAFCIATALALIPIYSTLSLFFDSIVALATHSGRYGTGDIGFARADIYIPDLVRLFYTGPAMVVIPFLATTAMLIIWIRTRGTDLQTASRKEAWRAAVICLLQMISFLVVAKQESPHYLIPLYLSTGINLALLYRSIQRSASVALPSFMSMGMVVIVFALGTIHMLVMTPNLRSNLSQAKRDQLAIRALVKERSKDAVRVEYYRSISPEFALYFGNTWAGRAFARELEAKYPASLFLCIWNGYFENFSDYIEPGVITQKCAHLYFFGNFNKYRFDWHAKNLKYFDAKGLSDIDSQGEYVLQEWIRP